MRDSYETVMLLCPWCDKKEQEEYKIDEMQIHLEDRHHFSKLAAEDEAFEIADGLLEEEHLSEDRYFKQMHRPEY